MILEIKYIAAEALAKIAANVVKFPKEVPDKCSTAEAAKALAKKKKINVVKNRSMIQIPAASDVLI